MSMSLYDILQERKENRKNLPPPKETTLELVFWKGRMPKKIPKYGKNSYQRRHWELTTQYPDSIVQVTFIAVVPKLSRSLKGS